MCYFGLRESLVQTQVLPYLRQIRDGGTKVSILTFEPELKKRWTASEIEIERKRLANEGIKWYFLTYHKRLSAPATLYDVLCGVYFILKLMRREKIDILHARSHVATLMGAITKKLSRRKPKLLFDIRGFFPEEYVDAGNWKENGQLFKITKKVERWLLQEADGFVVLTEKARQILFPESRESGFDNKGRPVEVIPCCVDLNRFKEISENDRTEMRRRHLLENRQVITYVGSLGTWYMTEEMTDFMQTAKKHNPSVFALFLTQSPPDSLTELLKRKGFTSEDFLIKKIVPDEVGYYLSGADIALSFIKPCYSKLSSSPTKVAEYLASGIPVVANGGVGDIDEQIEIDNSGAIIRAFTPQVYLETLEKLASIEKKKLSGNCKFTAETRFDLEKVGGFRYRRLYERLLQK